MVTAIMEKDYKAMQAKAHGQLRSGQSLTGKDDAFAPHKKATVLYNYLNLPGKITVSGIGGGELNFVYDAAGNKLKKTYGSTTNYYHGNAMKIGNTPIILTNEGRAVKDAVGWHYEYDLKDHLGNTRVSFAAGLAYNQAMNSLIFAPSFNYSQYSTAVSNFKAVSSVNVSKIGVPGQGLYKNFKANPTLTNPLIKNFFPLVR